MLPNLVEIVSGVLAVLGIPITSTNPPGRSVTPPIFTETESLDVGPVVNAAIDAAIQEFDRQFFGRQDEFGTIVA